MNYKTLPAVSIPSLAIVFALHAQQAKPRALTALDYIEIQQLANRYAQAIDTCANNGYDYADLYTRDGKFTDNFTEEGFAKHGLVRAEGREALARAAGGGSLGCKNVGWKDWSHLMVNRDHAIARRRHRQGVSGGDRRKRTKSHSAIWRL